MPKAGLDSFYNLIGKDKLEYYVIYDLKDNVIAYLDNLDELIAYTGLRKKQVVYKFKLKEFLYYISGNSYLKIYKFLK